MPDCNYGMRSSSWGGGVFREYGYEMSQKSSQMFPSERLTP